MYLIQISQRSEGRGIRKQFTFLKYLYVCFIAYERIIKHFLYNNDVVILLARLRRPPAAFLLNRAITGPAASTKTFTQTSRSYMQSFIKIGVLVQEKSAVKKMTLCNFNKDVISLLDNYQFSFLLFVEVHAKIAFQYCYCMSMSR